MDGEGTPRSRLLPLLYYTHPGYFMVATALTITHLLFGIDALMGEGRHGYASWHYITVAVGGHFWLWALAHWAVVVLVVGGLYWRGHFALARWGFFVSLLICNLIGLGFLLAFLTVGSVSLYAPVATLALSTVSIAALLEGEVNPAMGKTSQ